MCISAGKPNGGVKLRLRGCMGLLNAVGRKPRFSSQSEAAKLGPKNKSGFPKSRSKPHDPSPRNELENLISPGKGGSNT